MDNLKVKINKEGEIIVEFGEMSEKRIKEYVDLFEEIIGPTKEVVSSDTEPTPVAIIRADEEREQESIEKKKKKRQKFG